MNRAATLTLNAPLLMLVAALALSTPFTAGAAPHTVAQPTADGFQLDATLPADLLPASQTLVIGLSVVIEAADGSKSYWALAHGASQPDFHLRQSFALTLHRTTT